MSIAAYLGGYSASSSGEVFVRLSGFSAIDYNKNIIRKALRVEVNAVRDIARSLVQSAPTSQAGSFPARRTGVLMRAIKSKTSRSGLAAFARPQKTARMGEHYYPAYLAYGVRSGARVGKLAPGQGVGKSNRRRAGGRQAAINSRAATGWRIAPRGDYMHEALNRRRAAATEAIRAALQNALVPRK